MRKTNTFLIVFSMLFMLFLGFALGVLVIHIQDKKREEELVKKYEQEITEIERVVDETTHVYVPARKIEQGNLLKNPYITENFVMEDGFMAYYDENGEKISHLGVDLSYHNEEVDWAVLAASPVEFVMLRCGYRGYTEGGLVEDERFREYAQACNDNGLKLGVYFFTQAISTEEALYEADYVIDLIKDYDISYPVAFDTEYVDDKEARTNKAELTKDELTDICITFCDRIKEAGYHPMVYASENWFRRQLDVKRLTDYDYWAPQYLDENDFLFDFTMWQYTDSGNAPGVKGVCDIDISLVDYAEFVPAIKQVHDEGGEIEEYEVSGSEDSHYEDGLTDKPDITITPIDNNVGE